MERGVKALVRILVAALLLGGLVIAFHPDYRATMAALWRGQAETSPIWRSNSDYYPELTWPPAKSHESSK